MLLRILRMTKFILPYRWQFIFLLFDGFFSGLVNGGVAAMTGFFVKLFSDNIPNERALTALLGKYAELPYLQPFLNTYGDAFSKMNLFYGGVVIFVVLVILMAVSLYYQSYISEWLAARVGTDTRMFMTEKLLQLDFSFFKKMRMGDILMRINGDLHLLGQALFLLTIILTRPMNILVCFVYIFIINWQLALWAMIGMPIAIVILNKLSKKMRSTAMLTQKWSVNVSDSMVQFIGGISTVKSFACEDFELKNFREHNEKVFLASAKRSRAVSAERPITSLCSKVGVLVVFIISGQMIIANELSPGDLMTFLVALSFMYAPGKELSKANASLQTCLPGAERVFEILDTPIMVVDGKNTLNGFNRDLTFKHINFAYEPNKPVIKDFSLTIKKGKSLALVGVSGSGKTTLFNLLLRLYDVDNGEICLDGGNIRDFTFKSLRAQMALVSQHPFLFNCSVRENISYGRTDVTQAEIEQAARAANLHHEIMQMPQGYATPVGDRGEGLSGGQRQRLSIARAICKNAPILLLDEATSALDSENEQEVQIAINNLRQNRTTITIAHRLSTVKHCDEIVMLKDGQIIGQAPHTELIKTCPDYARLVELQNL